MGLSRRPTVAELLADVSYLVDVGANDLTFKTSGNISTRAAYTVIRKFSDGVQKVVLDNATGTGAYTSYVDMKGGFCVTSPFSPGSSGAIDFGEINTPRLWRNAFLSGYSQHGSLTAQRAIFNSRPDENYYEDFTNDIATTNRTSGLYSDGMVINADNWSSDVYSIYSLHTNMAGGTAGIIFGKKLNATSRTYVNLIYRTLFTGAVAAFDFGVATASGYSVSINMGTNPNTISFSNNGPIGTTTTDNIACVYTDYHVYEIKIKAGRIELHLDGALVATHTTNVDITESYLGYVNVTDDTTNDAVLYIDYAHFIQGVEF